MNSQAIKTAFAAAGFSVRVKTLRYGSFRICLLAGAHTTATKAVAASLGLTGADGILGGIVNQAHEMFSYAPGAIRTVAA